MSNKLRIAALAAVCLLAAPFLAYAAGIWSTLPGIGLGSYCASTVSGVTLPASQGPYGVVPGSTQGTGAGICGQTVPAGPTAFTGTEYAAFDTQALGTASNGGQPSTAIVSIQQLAQGQLSDVTSPATATIPAGVVYYVLDGAQGSAFTITMPAIAIDGQFQIVSCELATVGALTVAANTNQTLKGNPGAACVAGTSYKWRFNGANTTWYRI